MSQVAQGSDNRVEMSQNLRVTLQRAGTYASEQSHRFVTIEHILLALNEDPEAELMLQACEIDQGRLHSDVSNYLGRLEDRLSSGEPAQPVLDTEAARIVNSAVIAAQKSRRSEVNGAIVLAAIIGDGQTPAAQMLLAQGLNFKAAIDALQTAKSTGPSSTPLPHMQGNGKPEQPDTPANDERGRPTASTAEDALAQARERIRATQEAARHNLPLKPSNLQNGTSPSNQVNGQASQPSGHDQAPAAPAAPASPPSQPAPQALQTEDSLARYERRTPPQGAAANSEPQPETPTPMPSRATPVPASKDDEVPVTQPPMRRPPPEQLQESAGEVSESSATPPGDNPPPVPSSSPPAQPPAVGHATSPIPDQLRRPDPQQFERAPQQPPEPQQSTPPAPQPRPSPPPERARAPAPAPVTDGIRRPPPPSQQPAPPAYRPPPPGYGQHQPTRAPAGQQPGSSYGTAAQQADRRDLQGHSAPPTGTNLPVPVEPPAPQQSGVPIHPGQLVENIPRRMTKDVSQIIEVRIARADLSNLADGMQGQGLAQRHELVITQAMSLRLRAPNGGFFIETSSPETQWVESKLGLLSDDFASWRWTITPQRAGRETLQLIVSARTVGGDGLMAETALPDQVFEVRVQTNYRKLLARWTGWAVAAVIGGLFAKFGEQILSLGQAFFAA